MSTKPKEMKRGPVRKVEDPHAAERQLWLELQRVEVQVPDDTWEKVFQPSEAEGGGFTLTLNARRAQWMSSGARRYRRPPPR